MFLELSDQRSMAVVSVCLNMCVCVRVCMCKCVFWRCVSGIERLHQTDLTSVRCLSPPCTHPPDIMLLPAEIKKKKTQPPSLPYTHTHTHAHFSFLPPFSPSTTSPFNCISSRRPLSLLPHPSPSPSFTSSLST